MANAAGRLVVDPLGASCVVSLTGGTVYSDAGCSAVATFPQTITASTSYYVVEALHLTLSAKFAGTENANGAGGKLAVYLSDGSGQYVQVDAASTVGAAGVPVDGLVFNVTDHGAVADGATDNTASYAALVTTANAAGGGTILFPPQTNQYMGALVLNGNVPIKILGYGATVQGLSAGTAVTINTQQTGGSGQTVQLEGLTIKGNADQSTDGVLVKDTSRARIVNCQIVRVANGIRIQNATAGQNSEGTTVRSTLINDCVTGIRFEILSGGPSFDETFITDAGINNCTTGIYLPTGANFVRTVIDATVWVGRTGSTNGVLMYSDADMTRMWAHLGGEKYFSATSCTGVQIGPNAFGSDLADISLHLQTSISPIVDLTPANAGQIFLWREGLAHRAQGKGAAGSNMVGPHTKLLGDTYPRSGFSMGSASNAPMPGGRDGFFLGSGSAQPDVVLFRPGTPHVLQQGYADVFKTGQATSPSRPVAATVGVGAQFFDQSLNRPIWTDGTTWYASHVDKPPVTKTTSYTLTVADVLTLFNGATLTATLPVVAATMAGVVFTVKNINASAVTVSPASGTIDGAASATLAQWATGRYVSDGTNWFSV
jgi:hypothetical protein